ncbi:MAG: AAA family ATPase [Clostridia bacterium]
MRTPYRDGPRSHLSGSRGLRGGWNSSTQRGGCDQSPRGVLFLDEIGELHPIQMNKLLKVLEDRKVMLESSYYSSENSNIPSYIHEIFQKGLPADFRLIGATTRGPEDIPPAIRSRCTEIYFRGLRPDEIRSIVEGAAEKGGFTLEEGIPALIASYCDNGRDASIFYRRRGALLCWKSGLILTRAMWSGY